MSVAFCVWSYVAVAMLITTIPVTVECLARAVINRDDRVRALLWPPLCWSICALWPIVVVAGLIALIRRWRSSTR